VDEDELGCFFVVPVNITKKAGTEEVGELFDTPLFDLEYLPPNLSFLVSRVLVVHNPASGGLATFHGFPKALRVELEEFILGNSRDRHNLFPLLGVISSKFI